MQATGIMGNTGSPSVDQLMDVSYRVQCAVVSPIGILFRLQIGLEDRFEHQNCRHFHRRLLDSSSIPLPSSLLAFSFN